MDYLEPTFQHYPHHDQLSAHGISLYTDAQHYPTVHHSASMIAMSNPTPKTNETKPRLGKDEVEILEREFKKNPKPTTQTKRHFADDMAVDLARINNWFQNRRAKRKQEKKQEAFDAGQAQNALGNSEPSSPDLYPSTAFYSDNSANPLEQQSSIPVLNGPPPPVAPYNPQYTDSSSASLESLHRTMAAADAMQPSSQQHEYQNGFIDHNDSLQGFGSGRHGSLSNDRAPFSSAETSIAHFDADQTFSYPSTLTSDLFDMSGTLEPSPVDTTSLTLTLFHTYPNSSADTVPPQIMTAFPSQLLPSQSHDSLPLRSYESNNHPNPENSTASTLAIDFKYDLQESDNSSGSPPGPSIPFKSPPPPMDIASRRKKVQVKPAALLADTSKSRPSMGPRTVSHAEGFRRPAESPISSPMRRIASAGGNRNVMCGRISKPGVESAQRSPINLGGFADAEAFMEHNYQNFRNAPSLTGGSSLNSSLAPPTPMSPREREMTLAARKNSQSTASSVESLNFVFNTGVPGCFTTMEGDQNLASPPETPQAPMNVHSSDGWSNAVDFQNEQWHYEVPDEPLYTPAQGSFPLELHMPQPSYLSSMSQPVTPAFGHFNPNFMFGNESPHYQTESPQLALSMQGHSEYTFPDSNSHYAMEMLASPMTKQKTFQFSNATAADFSEK